MSNNKLITDEELQKAPDLIKTTDKCYQCGSPLPIGRPHSCNDSGSEKKQTQTNPGS